MQLLSKNNLPTENPTLRLDIKPVQDGQQPTLFGQVGSVGSISATPTITSTRF